LGKARPRLRKLVDELARLLPHLDDPEAQIIAGSVVVDGIVRTNPQALVRLGASISIRAEPVLRGERKLQAALDAFGVRVAGRVALDVGAAAGGFTRVLLRAGATRVYAVDAGHGQLLGSLRIDPRVVNLERTNLADVSLPEPVDVLTIDLSYLALADAVPQLARIDVAAGADCIALVKPQFELRVSRPPDPSRLPEAAARARAAFESNGWRVVDVIESPVRGARGANELLLHSSLRGRE
jgi:23S rRNA (cytidine1920-2'-O)/16S rRNA (cytidine1409-2'-O)-methyltransferase